MPDIMGTIQPGKVFAHIVALDDVPGGCRATARREALKVLIRP
jgi:threonine dehydrogenase-like Zn-dependent dehydrogenase